MTASLTFRGCLERSLSDPKKPGYCTTSILAGAFVDLFPSERAKRSALLLERGLVHATAGDHAAARADFAQALVDAAEARPVDGIALPRDLAKPRVAGLFARMQSGAGGSAAQVLWLEVVGEVSCRSAGQGRGKERGQGQTPPELCVHS